MLRIVWGIAFPKSGPVNTDEQSIIQVKWLEIEEYNFGIELCSNELVGFKIEYDMTSIQEFRVMPFEEKCDLVTYSGQYLMHRFLGDCKVFLYHSSGFFIEVFYSPKYQKVLMINAFGQSIGLEPYLATVSLTDLEGRPTI
jgi:hypothetical protein